MSKKGRHNIKAVNKGHGEKIVRAALWNEGWLCESVGGLGRLGQALGPFSER